MDGWTDMLVSIASTEGLITMSGSSTGNQDTKKHTNYMDGRTDGLTDGVTNRRTC